MKFEMAEIKVEKFEIMDVITTSTEEECWTDGVDCDSELCLS